MNKKIYSQQIGDEFVVVDSEANQSYVVSQEQHENLVNELGSTSRRDLLKGLGVAALATPVLASGLLPKPAAAASGGVTISITTVANTNVTATVSNPPTGPNPLTITMATAAIIQVAPTPGGGSFTLTPVAPVVPPNVVVPQGGSAPFTFSIVNNAVTPAGNYLIGFRFTITTPTGTCEEIESVFFTAP